MKIIFLIIIVLLLLNLYYMYSCSQKYECFESSITPEQLNVLAKLSPHLIAIKTLADLSASLMKGSLTIPGGLNILGPLTVGGDATVSGDTTLKKELMVNGATDLQQNVVVKGATTLNNTLTVDGDTNIKKILRVDGATDLKQNVIVRGNTSLEKQLIVTGEADLKNNVTVRGDTSLKKSLTVVGKVIAPDSITTPKILITYGTDINGTGVLLTNEGNEGKVGFNVLTIKDSHPINKTGKIEIYSSTRETDTGIFATRHQTNRRWLGDYVRGAIDK